MHGAGRLLLLAVIALVHVGGIWWLALGRDRAEEAMAEVPERLPAEPQPPSDVAAETGEASDEAGGEPSTESTAQPQLPSAPADARDKTPLPPPGTPLASVLEELEARAERGDRSAACRLALDSVLCQQQTVMPSAARAIGRAATERDGVDEDAIDLAARWEERAARGARVCAGLAPDWADVNAWRHLLAAARTDARMATRFALVPPMSPDLIDLQLEAWQAHREQATALLLGAAMAGEPHALYWLQRIHQGVPMRFDVAHPIVPDADTAMVYALVLQRFGDVRTRFALQTQIDAGRAARTPEAWRAIEAEATALFEQKFASQTPVDFSTDPSWPPDSTICETP